jgi:tetratricopeptide (TPR) repeat protein
MYERRSGLASMEKAEGESERFNSGVARMHFDLRGALSILEECLPRERQVSADGRGNPIILSQLALAARLTGRTDDAARYLSEALALAQEQREAFPYAYARAAWMAGRASLAEGDIALARDRFEAAARGALDLSDGHLAPRALWDLARLARRAGDGEHEEALLAESTAAAGPAPELSLTLDMQIQRAEFLLARHDVDSAAELIRGILIPLKGKATGNRITVYTVLLLCADMELARGHAPHTIAHATRLLGAARSVAERLGLEAPEPTERERTDRLAAFLTEKLGQNHRANEEALGAALDDEAALELTLTD